MGDIFSTEDSVFFVGGRGTKAGNSEAGGCTKSWWDDKVVSVGEAAAMVALMGTNGEPIIDNSASSDASIDWSVSQTEIDCDTDLSDVEVGMVAYLEDTGASPVFAAGRYEITAVNLTKIYCDLVVDNGGSSSNVKVRVGGAFSSIKDLVPDEVDASSNNVTIFTNKDETLTSTLTVTCTGDHLINKWLQIVGIDDNGVELTYGNYVTWDGTGSDFAGTAVVEINDAENLNFRNIWAKNDASPVSGENGFVMDNTAVHCNYIFTNCKVTDAYYGWHGTDTLAQKLVIMDCVTDVSNTAVFGNCAALVVLDSILKAAGDYGVYTIYGCTLIGNYIYGGTTRNVRLNNTGTYIIKNNVLHGASSSAIYASDEDVQAIIENNIIWVSSVGYTHVLLVTGGSVAFEDYNYTNATTNSLLTGVHSLNSLSDADIAFVDAANGDFRLKPGSIALNTGKPNTDGGFANIGAWQKRQRAGSLGGLHV
jgi:hypothetical protein